MKGTFKTTLLIFLDAILVVVSYYISILIRFEGNLIGRISQHIYLLLLSMVIIKLFVYLILGLYNSLWRYAGINELISQGDVLIATRTAKGTF